MSSEYGVARLLDELAADLKDGSCGRCRPPGVHPEAWQSSEQRPLSIPAVRDRVVQAALKTVIEPIFEADMLAVLVRVSAQALGARRASGPH